jgi:TolB-like protein/class 3 adenylate cyclase
MASEIKKEIELEIAHVLFIDIVGYSKLLIDEQRDYLHTLNEVVRETDSFRAAEAAGKLTRLPTGDGMALVFATTPDAPVSCALQVSKALRSRPELRVRMGIHSGPVSGITDVNDRSNVAGAGINIAQRVMDCGDAGHILLSKHVADDLEQYRQWRSHLHDLGECAVKHDVRVHVVNLYTDELGNPEVPGKFQQTKETHPAPAAPVSEAKPARRSWTLMAALIIAVAIAAAAGFYISSHRPGPKAPPSSIAPAASAIPEKSIAVLPFENLSRDPDNAYFADGIQDEILTRLSKIADLKVISRTSTQHYKSAPENLPEIAKQLGVRNILEGSVQRAADQVRINVQLLDAQTDSHLWGESYDRKLNNIFEIESEVAKAIADSLQAKLTVGEQQALAVIPTNNPAAYDAYLRGLAYESRASVSAANFKDVARSYREAVDLDPKFALAWARLAIVNSRISWYRFNRSAQPLADARQALETASKLQPNLAEVYLARGVFQATQGEDFDSILKDFKAALQRLPNSADVMMSIGNVERRQGRWQEALTSYERAARLDPRNPNLLFQWAGTHVALREFAQVHSLLDRALNITPDDTTLIASKAVVDQAQGNLTAARKLLTSIPPQPGNAVVFTVQMEQLMYERNYSPVIAALKAALVKPDPTVGANFPDYFILLGLAQTRLGDSNSAHETFLQAKDVLESLYKNGDNSSYLAADLGLVYANLGDKFAALREYQRAVSEAGIDAMFAPNAEEVLAKIDAQFGDIDGALSILPRVLKVPYFSWLHRSGLTPALLRLDPIWDPLRKDPRFQKLASPGSK